MPQISNITVKKNDGTTDVTFTAVVPSAGDKQPAVWRSTTVGSAPAHQPTLSLVAGSNGPGSARRLRATLTYPSTVTGSDGRVSISDRAIVTVEGVIPQNMDQNAINEAVSQAMNVFASSLVKDCFKSGYSAT